MDWYYLPILVFVLVSGCIGENDSQVGHSITEVTGAPTPLPSPSPSLTQSPETALPTTTQKLEQKASDNLSVAVEVNYREYVDWFINHNLNIRSYTPQEYVCGQYTSDMINDSKKAGFSAYFAAVKFSDGTGHALVSFKSTVLGMTSWYFFEPQTNNLMTPETLAQELSRGLGEKVTEVNIYGYFDDAGDKDPTTWRFANLLYNKKY